MNTNNEENLPFFAAKTQLFMTNSKGKIQDYKNDSLKTLQLHTHKGKWNRQYSKDNGQ